MRLLNDNLMTETALSQAILFAGLGGAEALEESYQTLLTELSFYLNESEIREVTRAVQYGAKAHDGQLRQSGGPYFTHPIAVCVILAEQRFDVSVLQAGLLHDVLEDTDVVYQEMADEFGEEVTRMVDGVSKLERLKNQAPQEVQAESFRKMFVATTDDPRVIIIKLADRLHNMQTLGALRPDKRIRKARETLEVYASIAGRLGLFYFRLQLEDLAFSHLYPWRYAVLKKHYAARFKKNDVITRVRNELGAAIQELGIKASINKRKRHLWGLYLRMKRKQSFAEACRTITLRIVTENEDDCYRILGRVHALYRPISGKFEDFIAAPKSNGYRSIHTSVLMAKRDVLNIQIRTRDMHTLAEGGIISVWHQHLKQKNLRYERHTIEADKYMRDWLSRLKEVQNITHDPLEFYEAIKKELSHGEIHVYTPKGKVIDLPRGATPVDFAYAIHTEVGNHCIAARVNGHDYPIFKPLEVAQSVEVITDADSHPNASWLQFVVTAKARAAINYHLRSLAEREAQAVGARYLDIALQRLGSNAEKLDLSVLSDYLRIHKLDKATLYQKLANGELQPALVASALLGKQLNSSDEQRVFVVYSALDTAADFAACCHPIPYENVIGELLPSIGIRIHRRSCHYAEESNRLDWIRVQWGKQTRGTFACAVEIDVKERRRVLAAVSAVMAEQDVNIDDFYVEPHVSNTDWRTLHCILEVRNRDHLAQIIRQLRNIDDVVVIRRV